MGELLLGRLLEVSDMAAIRIHRPNDMLDDSILAASIEGLEDDEQRTFSFGEEVLLEIAHLLAQFFDLFQRFMLLVFAFVAWIEVAKADAFAWRDPKILYETFAGHPWFPMAGVYSS